MERKSSVLTVKFLDFDIRADATYYKVLVSDTTNQISWSLDPWRYSTLHSTDKQIRSGYKGLLPDFPPKKWLGNKNVKFVTQRQKALENYLNIILKNVDLDKVLPLKNFLFKNRPSTIPNSAEKSVQGRSTISNNNNVAANEEMRHEETKSNTREEHVKKIMNKMIENSYSFEENVESSTKSRFKDESLNNLNIKAKIPSNIKNRINIEIEDSSLNEEETEILELMREATETMERELSSILRE